LGRVFRLLKPLVLPLRQALAFAASADACPDPEVGLVVGRRAVVAVQRVATCDAASADAAVRGAVCPALFEGKGGNSAFALLATPLAALRTRVVTAREYRAKEPRFTSLAILIADVLQLLEERGGAPARRSIAAAFPGGFSG
jgi:hypothetical protein